MVYIPYPLLYNSVSFIKVDYSSIYWEIKAMAKIIEAIYKDGVLKPLEKLDLIDGQRVRIAIVEKDFVQVAREIRMRLREKLKGKDLMEELIQERKRFAH